MLRIGVLASHQGTNFQAIADACASGSINAMVAVLICNNYSAPAMQRAEKAGIAAHHLSSRTHPDPAALDTAICKLLQDADVGLVVLAGYMKKLGDSVLATFQNRIINVHPSLLPRHGGKGLYGHKVHAAVLAAGDAETGASVHLVTAEYDAGKVLMQEKTRVKPEDTPASLADRVHKLEHRLLINVINQFATGAMPCRNQR